MKIRRGKQFLPFEEPLIYILIVLGVAIASIIVIYAMKKRGKREKELEEKVETDFKPSPFKILKTVPKEEAVRAREELRILELEREILSDAIRRLYEAHAEGKITEEERERLARTYKSRMMAVKEAMSKDETLVALHELEAMQEDLIKLFSERFDELSSKIEELRSKVEIKPVKEISIPAVKEPSTAKTEKLVAEEKAKRRRKRAPAKPSPRTEAEKRIEKIRAEVEKVLEKLGQMEIET